MKRETRALILISLVGMLFLTMPVALKAEERISGIVISIHLTPGFISSDPGVIVSFADGRKKIFAFDILVQEIKINKFNIIRHEGNKIIEVECGGKNR